MSDDIPQFPAQTPPAETPKPVTPFGWIAYGLAATVIVLDQVSKYWILHVVDLPTRGQVPVTPFFSLSMVWNRGVSFGLLRAEADLARWGLAGFAVVVAIALAIWARKADRTLTGVALGLIIGGAIGNVIDRIRFGAVTDFLDFTGLGFPWVFNVADSGVTVGVALVLLESVIGQRKA
jgi:signal peptidase II